ncbi:MAG TPA: hypothetical protein VGS80_12525 [Ktedonobacterales bacterium]|nr:hypothetical protein [Ktedonobacterales bacterium]
MSTTDEMAGGEQAEIPDELQELLGMENVSAEMRAEENAGDVADTDAEIRDAVRAVKAAMKAAEYEAPSEALRRFYQFEKPAVVATCEEARKQHRRGVVALQMAHDAFAGKGREGRFKEWCGLAGINYGSAKNAVSRAKKEAEPVRRAKV